MSNYSVKVVMENSLTANYYRENKGPEIRTALLGMDHVETAAQNKVVSTLKHIARDRNAQLDWMSSVGSTVILQVTGTIHSIQHLIKGSEEHEHSITFIESPLPIDNSAPDFVPNVAEEVEASAA